MPSLTPFTPQDLVDNLQRKWAGEDSLLGGYVGVVNAVLGNGRYMVRRTADTDDAVTEVVGVGPINYDIGDRVVMLPVLGGETYLIGHDNAGGVFDLKAFTVQGSDPVAVDPWSPGLVRVMEWYANSAGTTFDATGMPVPTVSGSFSSFDGSAGPHVRMDTGAVISNTAGAVSAYTLVRTDWNPKLLCKITTGSSMANIRMWVGLFSGDPRASGAPALHFAAFRWDTALDTAFWRAMTGDGAARTATYGTNFAAGSSDPLDLYIDLTSARAQFYINNVFIAEITTTLPAASQKLGIVVGVTTLEASLKMARLNRVSLSHK